MHTCTKMQYNLMLQRGPCLGLACTTLPGLSLMYGLPCTKTLPGYTWDWSVSFLYYTWTTPLYQDSPRIYLGLACTTLPGLSLMYGLPCTRTVPRYTWDWSLLFLYSTRTVLDVQTTTLYPDSPGAYLGMRC